MRNQWAALAVLLAIFHTAEGADWPAFRGPRGDGISTEKSFPTVWGPEKNVKWKAELPGTGNGSPIVSGGRVFVAAAKDRGAVRSLYCLDRKDGRQVWVRSAKFEPGEETHPTNPYAGSTPAADGRRVVVWHGSAGLYCYDFAGKELWSIDPGDVEHEWGYGSSPVIHRDRVLLNFGPGEQTFMAAVNLNDGMLAWKTEEPGGNNTRKPRMIGSWSTPLVAEIDGKPQVICSMPTRVVAYDFDSGEIVWMVGGLDGPRGDLVYTSQLIAGDIGVAMGGYGGPAIGFKLGGQGDTTDKNRLWRVAERQPQRIGSGVIIGKHIYMANAGPGIVECLELETGNELWRERLSGGHWGSLVYAGGLLYVTNQDGTTRVFRPNPEKYEPVASNELGEPTNATPAFSDGEIFLRTTKHVYCIAD